MDLEEKKITLLYLQKLLKLKQEYINYLINTLVQIRDGKSGVNMLSCVSDLHSALIEINKINNDILDLSEEIEDIVPKP